MNNESALVRWTTDDIIYHLGIDPSRVLRDAKLKNLFPHLQKYVTREFHDGSRTQPVTFVGKVVPFYGKPAHEFRGTASDFEDAMIEFIDWKHERRDD